MRPATCSTIIIFMKKSNTMRSTLNTCAFHPARIYGGARTSGGIAVVSNNPLYQGDNTTMNNPLYKGDGNQGTNPIYKGG